MKSKLIAYILLFIGAILCYGCSDEQPAVQLDCRDFLLSHLQLEPFEGQDIGCRSFYTLVEYEGELYTYLDNYCADIAYFSFIDCDGDTVCTTQESSCNILSEGTDMGILGL